MRLDELAEAITRIQRARRELAEATASLERQLRARGVKVVSVVT